MTVKKTESLNLYQRLHAIMGDISYVQKEDKKVNNQYKFVSHDAVTAVVRGALEKHRVFANPVITSTIQNGNRTECELDIIFINIDNPAETLTTHSFGYGIDPQDKGPGKAYSYAYKYGMLKAFALETGDDPERDNIDHKAQEKVPPINTRGGVGRSTEEAFTTIKMLIESANNLDELKQTWTVNSDDMKTLSDEQKDALNDAKDHMKSTFEKGE